MIYAPVAAIALSMVSIFMLCVSDPKRLRSIRSYGHQQSMATRRLLTMCACIPGLYLAFSGNGAAFLIWLGGVGVMGWILTLVAGARPQA
jgi:hypothetical protein